jgi:hypothetical protein
MVEGKSVPEKWHSCNGPAPVDATGCIINGGSSIWSTPRAAGGSVHVSAHSREGGKVAVSAYDRSAPSR